MIGKKKLLLCMGIALALLSGCGNAENNENRENLGTPTETISEDAGALTPVPTEISAVTNTPVPVDTPVPTLTLAPTVTPAPTDTPAPTLTPTPRTLDINEYVMVCDGNGETQVNADVSTLKTYADTPEYKLTVLFEDGTYDEQRILSDTKNISAAFDKAIAKYEIVPVYKFSLGNDKATGAQGYSKVKKANVFEENTAYGFIGNVDSCFLGMSFKTTESYFALVIPDGLYDVTVKKTEDGRTTMMLNDGAFAINVGINGNGRKGSIDRTYTAKDVAVTDNLARISVSGGQNIALIELVRASSLVPRKTHIYIAGDSTVATYYPRTFTKEPDDGTAQTGWGQVFEYYTTDDVIVDPLGSGGTYARSWYEMYFKGIMNNAHAGDYFIIQEGINDRSYSSVSEMVEYLTIMIDWCRENQVIPVLVTSQQSVKFWKDAGGNDVGEYGEPEGSSLNAFMVAIRDLAGEKNVFLVDNAALTGAWYKTVGRTYVAEHYHLFNASTNTSADTLHLSYAGAKKIAEMIATNLYEQIIGNATDANQNTLSGIKLNDLTEYNFTYTNSDGETVERVIRAVYFDGYRG